MSEIEQARTEFIEAVGMISQGEGLPRIAGRVLGLLIFDGAELSFSKIAETLKVSRGSISSSVRMLTDWGLIRRTSKPGQRQDYFVLTDDPYRKLLERSRLQAAAASRDFTAIADRTPDGANDARGRIQALADFYGLIGQVIARTLVETKHAGRREAGMLSDD